MRKLLAGREARKARAQARAEWIRMGFTEVVQGVYVPNVDLTRREVEALRTGRRLTPWAFRSGPARKTKRLPAGPEHDSDSGERQASA